MNLKKCCVHRTGNLHSPSIWIHSSSLRASKSSTTSTYADLSFFVTTLICIIGYFYTTCALPHPHPIIHPACVFEGARPRASAVPREARALPRLAGRATPRPDPRGSPSGPPQAAHCRGARRRLREGSIFEMTVSCVLFWSSGIRRVLFHTTFLLELLTILSRLNQVSRESRWYRIQEKMGFKPSKVNASTLKSHYEKILFPYDVFLSGVLTGDESVCRQSSLLCFPYPTSIKLYEYVEIK